MIETLDVFLAEFSVAVTLPGDVVVRGLFDNGFVNALGVATGERTLTMKSSDIEGLAHAQAVVVDGVSYKVAQIEPDGTGISVVRLQ
jgi:hypothetical protein